MADEEGPPLYISSSKVKELLNLQELISQIETALKNFSNKTNSSVVQPVRTVVPVEQYGGFLGVMPAYSKESESSSLGAKLVSFYSGNADLGLPTHTATIVLLDPRTGALLAILDGAVITEMRTAAASAVATKYLSSEDVKVLTILGSGHQARSHLAALRLVRKFEEVRVWSRNQAHAEKFACEHEGVKVCSTVEEAVRGADVIVTVTMAKEPVLFGKWVKEGAHVNAIGACRPDQRELDDELMQSSVVVVDSREAAEKESGDVILSKAVVAAEVGDVASGTVKIDCTKRTVFKSLGMAIEDVVSAQLVYDSYVKRKGSPHFLALSSSTCI
ncbi:ketimine reductase mu-crystallin-like [Oscarella lobularis]|uniref:ketimine reductase mu-crystallin-like n=1 Tax=Oscarella lobularis TaxID=121494 RepID=UPI003313248E